jgi:cell shape-determining protein MreC
MIFDMPETLIEALDLGIRIGLLLLIFIFILVGVRLLTILGAVRQLTESIAEIVETVNMVLWQPVRFVSTIVEKMRKFMGKK